MKLSIARLKEIIMEEVGRATLQETHAGQALKTGGVGGEEAGSATGMLEEAFIGGSPEAQLLNLMDRLPTDLRHKKYAELLQILVADPEIPKELHHSAARGMDQDEEWAEKYGGDYDITGIKPRGHRRYLEGVKKWAHGRSQDYSLEEGHDGHTNVEDTAMEAMKAIYDLASAAGVDLYADIAGPSDEGYGEDREETVEIELADDE